MFSNITDLIYENNNQSALILNVKDKIRAFNKVSGKSHLHYAKLVQDLTEMLDLNEEQEDEHQS